MCRDAGEFLRAAFKRSVPLVIVDLPAEESPDYWAVRDATTRVKQLSTALLVVAGFGAAGGEELWARQLGAWSYLSEAHAQRGFEVILSEARTALARQGHDAVADENLAAATWEDATWEDAAWENGD